MKGLSRACSMIQQLLIRLDLLSACSGLRLPLLNLSLGINSDVNLGEEEGFLLIKWLRGCGLCYG